MENIIHKLKKKKKIISKRSIAQASLILFFKYYNFALIMNISYTKAQWNDLTAIGYQSRSTISE